jgi:hypothetical protein
MFCESQNHYFSCKHENIGEAARYIPINPFANDDGIIEMHPGDDRASQERFSSKRNVTLTN